VNTDPTATGGDYPLIGMKGGWKLDPGVAAQRLQYTQGSKNITLLDHRLFYHLIVSEDLKKLFGNGPVHTENRPHLEFAAPKLIYTDDPMIRQNISDKKWLSDKTREIIRRNSTDIDTQIDFVAYALSVFSPTVVLQSRMDLAAATSGQRQRLSDPLVDYCGKHTEGGLPAERPGAEGAVRVNANGNHREKDGSGERQNTVPEKTRGNEFRSRPVRSGGGLLF
jgi:hypothetical protein